MVTWHRPSRAVPKGVGAKVRFLLGRGKTPDTAGQAQKLGVTERTLKGWLTGKHKPSKKNAEKLGKAATDKWEDQARDLAKKHGEPYIPAAALGDGQGEAGGGGGGDAAEDELHPLGSLRFDGPLGLFGGSGSNYNRPRNITQPLSPDQGRRAARAYAAGDADALAQVAAEALADYFNTGGYKKFNPDSFDFDLGSCNFE